MISEGSVLAARSEPTGVAVDVAPDGFAHPVYRSGIALAMKLPVLNRLTLEGPVEVPVEDFKQRPCEEPAQLQLDSGADREEGSSLEGQPGAEGELSIEQAEQAPPIDESLEPEQAARNGQERTT